MADTTEYMLTTVDNPFDPFTQWDEWYAYDTSMGYHTLGLLDRVALNSNELSDAAQERIIQEAIDEIIFYNVSGMHRKVSKDSFVNTQTQRGA